MSALTVVELAERFMRVHVKVHCKPIAAKRAAGPTVGALAQRFLEEYAEVRYKPGTLAWTRTVIRRYIVPELGKLPLTSASAHRSSPFTTACTTRPPSPTRWCVPSR